MSRWSVLAALVCLQLAFTARVDAGPAPIFADDFESGSTCAWSGIPCCTGTIPPTAVVAGQLGGQVNITEDGVDVWACGNSSVVVNASNTRIFAEHRSDVVVLGQNNVIWAESPFVEVFLGDGSNTVVHEPDGEPSFLEIEPTLILCEDVVLDRSTAPANGC